MTALKVTVQRETAASIREAGKVAPIVIELHPGFMTLRQKGRRHRYVLDYTAAYITAARIQADEIRRERAAERAAKRGKR